ncbi:MAG: response regulator transcription factor [Alphaproteobacteria bacterium]|nr:response regulator transcription factor [Alphaproteobacteria bacterium]
MKLIIADDHSLLRDLLTTFIEEASPGASVSTCGSVDEVLGFLKESKDFDLIILDLRMPGMNGLNGIEVVKAASGGIPVALMSGVASRDDIQEALTRGAAGFVPKTLKARALTAAIDLMIGGEVFLPATTFNDHAPGGLSGDPDLIADFSKREKEVLSLLFKGLSNKEMAREMGLQEVTVKLHIRSLCKKLGAKNRTQAAMMALERGISA